MNKAQLESLCKRLRYMMAHAPTDEAELAYETALKLVIDEFFLHADYHHFFYGSESDYLTTWPSSIGN